MGFLLLSTLFLPGTLGLLFRPCGCPGLTPGLLPGFNQLSAQCHPLPPHVTWSPWCLRSLILPFTFHCCKCLTCIALSCFPLTGLQFPSAGSSAHGWAVSQGFYWRQRLCCLSGLESQLFVSCDLQIPRQQDEEVRALCVLSCFGAANLVGMDSGSFYVFVPFIDLGESIGLARLPSWRE